MFLCYHSHNFQYLQIHSRVYGVQKLKMVYKDVLAMVVKMLENDKYKNDIVYEAKVEMYFIVVLLFFI